MHAERFLAWCCRSKRGAAEASVSRALSDPGELCDQCASTFAVETPTPRNPGDKCAQVGYLHGLSCMLVVHGANGGDAVMGYGI